MVELPPLGSVFGAQVAGCSGCSHFESEADLGPGQGHGRLGLGCESRTWPGCGLGPSVAQGTDPHGLFHHRPSCRTFRWCSSRQTGSTWAPCSSETRCLGKQSAPSTVPRHFDWLRPGRIRCGAQWGQPHRRAAADSLTCVRMSLFPPGEGSGDDEVITVNLSAIPDSVTQQLICIIQQSL